MNKRGSRWVDLDRLAVKPCFGRQSVGTVTARSHLRWQLRTYTTCYRIVTTRQGGTTNFHYYSTCDTNKRNEMEQNITLSRCFKVADAGTTNSFHRLLVASDQTFSAEIAANTITAYLLLYAFLFALHLALRRKLYCRPSSSNGSYFPYSLSRTSDNALVTMLCYSWTCIYSNQIHASKSVRSPQVCPMPADLLGPSSVYVPRDSLPRSCYCSFMINPVVLQGTQLH